MKRLLLVSVGICLLLMACSVDDFLSLHDIEADYVSPSVLRYLDIQTSIALPAWTETRLEWTSVKVSYAARWALILSNLGVLVLLGRRIREASPVEPARKDGS